MSDTTPYTTLDTKPRLKRSETSRFSENSINKIKSDTKEYIVKYLMKILDIKALFFGKKFIHSQLKIVEYLFKLLIQTMKKGILLLRNKFLK